MRVWKPWYVWRPWQLLLRATRGGLPPTGERRLRAAWGAEFVMDPGSPCGRSIWTTGVYDLAVSEVLARLTPRGASVVDAGAHVGYMTLLAALAAGPEGRVRACEPHPDLVAGLRRNLEVNAHRPMARIEVFPVALGASSGAASFERPVDGDDVLGHVVSNAATGERTIAVEMLALDDLLGNGNVDVLKLDVEGYEEQVLSGGARALAARRIRDVIFEDHVGRESAVVELLRDAGFALFALGWTVGGPRIEPIEHGRLSSRYDAPSYLATLEPDRALGLLQPRGWRALTTRGVRSSREGARRVEPRPRVEART